MPAAGQHAVTTVVRRWSGIRGVASVAGAAAGSVPPPLVALIDLMHGQPGLAIFTGSWSKILQPSEQKLALARQSIALALDEGLVHLPVRSPHRDRLNPAGGRPRMKYITTTAINGLLLHSVL